MILVNKYDMGKYLITEYWETVETGINGVGKYGLINLPSAIVKIPPVQAGQLQHFGHSNLVLNPDCRVRDLIGYILWRLTSHFLYCL